MKRDKEIFDMCFCRFEQNLKLWLSYFKKEREKGKERKGKRWDRADITEHQINGQTFPHRDTRSSHKRFYRVGEKKERKFATNAVN